MTKKSLESEALKRLNKAREYSWEEKIDFLTSQCINWYLDKISYKSVISLLSYGDNWITVKNVTIGSTNIEVESILALYLFERVCELHKKYLNERGYKFDLLFCMNMDFNYVLHFALSNELIGLFSCKRINQLPAKGGIIIEMNIAKKLLGYQNVDYKNAFSHLTDEQIEDDSFYYDENIDDNKESFFKEITGIRPVYYLFSIDSSKSYVATDLIFLDNLSFNHTIQDFYTLEPFTAVYKWLKNIGDVHRRVVSINDIYNTL